MRAHTSSTSSESGRPLLVTVVAAVPDRCVSVVSLRLQVKSGSRVDDWPAGTQEALLDSRRRLLQYKPDPERRREMLDLITQVPPGTY